MRIAVLIAAVSAVLAGSPATATIRITHDDGGQLGPYLKHLDGMRKSGERIVIDGPCLSACTMLLGVVPRNRICVTSRAQLGFHAAWKPDQNGEQVTSPEGTALLMQHYPQPVRSWIAQRGGLSRQMIYLAGSELSSMYASCDGLADEGRAVAPASWRVGGSPARSVQARADAVSPEDNNMISTPGPHQAAWRIRHKK